MLLSLLSSRLENNKEEDELRTGGGARKVNCLLLDERGHHKASENRQFAVGDRIALVLPLDVHWRESDSGTLRRRRK